MRLLSSRSDRRPLGLVDASHDRTGAPVLSLLRWRLQPGRDGLPVEPVAAKIAGSRSAVPQA